MSKDEFISITKTVLASIEPEFANCPCCGCDRDGDDGHQAGCAYALLLTELPE